MHSLRHLPSVGPQTISGYPVEPSPLRPQLLVVKVGRKTNRAKETRNILLFSPAHKFCKGLIHGVLLSAKAADTLRPGKQAIVDL